MNEAELETLSSTLTASTLTVAELMTGLFGAEHDLEQRRRRQRLQWVETRVQALPFDLGCAHAYAFVYEAVTQVGRKPRGSRAVDLMIAATALAHGLPVYTLNAKDLRGLDGLIEIVDLGSKIGT